MRILSAEEDLEILVYKKCAVGNSKHFLNISNHIAIHFFEIFCKTLSKQTQLPLAI